MSCTDTWDIEHELLSKVADYLSTDMFYVEESYTDYNPVYDYWILSFYIKIKGKKNLRFYDFKIYRQELQIAQNQTRFMIDTVHHIYSTISTRVYQVLNPKRPVTHNMYRRSTKYATVKYKPKKGNYLIRRKKGK